MPMTKMWVAVCDSCGVISGIPRKDKDDLPQGWGRTGDYFRCRQCEQEYQEAMEERESGL